MDKGRIPPRIRVYSCRNCPVAQTKQGDSHTERRSIPYLCSDRLPDNKWAHDILLWLFYLSSFRSKTYDRIPRPERLRPQRHGFLAAPKIFQGKAWISRNSCDTKGLMTKCKFFGQWREGNNHLHSWAGDTTDAGDSWSGNPGVHTAVFIFSYWKHLSLSDNFISVCICNKGSSVRVPGVVGVIGDVCFSVDGLRMLPVLGGETLNCWNWQNVWSRLDRDRLFIGLEQSSLWPAMRNGVGSGWRSRTWIISPPSSIIDEIGLPSSAAALLDAIPKSIANAPKHSKSSGRLPQKVKKIMTSEAFGLQTGNHSHIGPLELVYSCIPSFRLIPNKSHYLGYYQT